MQKAARALSIRRGLGLVLLLVLGIVPALWANDMSWNMTEGVTPISREVHQLHMTIFYICVAIAILVFGIMFYALFKHRKSRGHQAAQFHESTKVEVLWTIIPFVILFAMAVPATGVIIRMNDVDDSELSIVVTGHQWRWEYEYLEDDINFFSSLSTPQDQIQNLVPKGEHYLREVDNPLVLPTDTKIRFLFTSSDVIHAWWVPDLGFKKDTIPGFINTNWALIEEPGIYRGQCAELCGVLHGFMPIVVDARTPEDYAVWVQEQQASAAALEALADEQWSLEDLVEHGEGVYMSSCATCHQADGSGMPPAFPAIAGSAIALGDIEQHVHTVLSGIPASAMPPFANLLSDTDIAAVVTYERHAFGNDEANAERDNEIMIQPVDVLQIREQLD